MEFWEQMSDGLQTDNNNQLWFANNRGLNRLDLNSLYNSGKTDIAFYNDENGFTDRLTNKCILDEEGNLLIISEEKLFKINPADFIKDYSKTNSLVLDGLDINFKPVEWPETSLFEMRKNLPEKRFEIPFNKNTLTFYFHLLQYSEPSKARYRFKLEGFQNDWTSYSRETKAVFTNLPDGNYIFKINGILLSNPDQITQLEIRFKILPPWWKTWWFISLALAFMLTGIYVFLNYRIRHIRKESEVNQRLASLKLDALKAQMNPHFIFNAFNSIQKYILNQDSKSALNYMSDFAALIRKTLDNSTKEEVSLTDEISYLRSYVELEKRRIPNLSYIFIIDERIDSDEYYIPPMLVQPVVENSILHGIRHMDKDGLISISFMLSSEDQLVCTIEDNGIGRSKSAELYKSQGKAYSSMGSKIIRERAGLFGVGVNITDLESPQHSSGTRVEFIFTAHSL